MISIYNNLYVNKHLMDGYDLSEVFSSIYNTSVREYSLSGIKEFNSVIKGTSLRVLNEHKNTGKMILQSEDTGNGFCEKYMQTIQVPYANLPMKAITPTELILPEMKNDSTDDLFQKLSKNALEYGINVQKITTNRFVSMYKIANSHGVEGFGYKLLKCANLSVTDRQNNYKEYSKVFSNGSFYETVKAMFPEISVKNNDSEIDMQTECVLLSCHAVSEVLFLLLLFLNEQVPFTGRNYITENNGGLYDVFNISPLINIVENSENNEVTGGNVDGEGSIKQPVYIVEQGRLKNLISSCGVIGHKNCTASAYRMEYKALPQCRPTKIWVSNGKRKVKDIINEKDALTIIESFQGMYESIDPLTLEFSSVIRAKIYRYGVHVGCKTMKIKSSLLKILSSITELANDMSYIGDGSIIVPAMVCDFKKI